MKGDKRLPEVIKRIGVIGTIINDCITPYKGETRRSFGGIFFTLLHLANIFNRDWLIVPMCQVGEDIYDEVIKELSKYENINTGHLIKVNRENTRVTLNYFSPFERDEITTEPMPPLSWHDIEMISGCDVIIVNFITGEELSLSTLQMLSENKQGILYEDYHTLAWGIDEKGRRFPFYRSDWMDWTSAADIVQMNEKEAATLLGLTSTPTTEKLKDLTKSIINRGTSVCIITLADKGAFVSYTVDNELQYFYAKPHPIRDAIDPTGCGDAFAAGFLFQYLQNKEAVEAARFANIVAANNCKVVGTRGIANIYERMKF